jgi:hypothetical protein
MVDDNHVKMNNFSPIYWQANLRETETQCCYVTLIYVFYNAMLMRQTPNMFLK